jgi:hypothetical protein
MGFQTPGLGGSFVKIGGGTCDISGTHRNLLLFFDNGNGNRVEIQAKALAGQIPSPSLGGLPASGQQ